MPKLHTDSAYEAELRRVRENLLHMTGHVEQMIASSVCALLEGDLVLARKTIENDNEVNQLEMDTDELCLIILAKRQPLASDLRFITTAMKMVTDLERIGDLAVNIAERVLALDGYRPLTFGPSIGQMSELDQVQIHDAIEAFVNGDAGEAELVLGKDEEVDGLYLHVTNAIQDAMVRDHAFVSQGVHLQAVAKFLERIGDHITNLAELVVFLVKGKDIRHLDKRERRPGDAD